MLTPMPQTKDLLNEVHNLRIHNQNLISKMKTESLKDKNSMKECPGEGNDVRNDPQPKAIQKKRHHT